MQTISISKILRGNNPRRGLVEANVSAIADSIRAQGLLQPILVTPNGDGTFKLVAGEHRLEAFSRVHGPNSEIDAFVRNLSDEEVAAAALNENLLRASMTPVEEAETAQVVLGHCKGDREEAAKRLGWSRSTLDKRLALMYATESVRNALQEGKIDLGHAELLAVLRKEAQAAGLTQLLSAPKLMTVAELKAYLDQHACKMDAAIFDKTDCANCHHNSGNQAALFAEVVSGGRCTNRSCFDAKTEAELGKRAEALKDEFQVIRIVRPGENLTLTKLVVDGANGVGPEQATACRTCKDFGAVVSGVPDKMGNVYKGMCMNVPCNKDKVKAFAESQKPPPVTQPSSNESKAAGATPQQTEKSAAGKSVSKDKPGSVEKPVVSSEPSNRVKEYREGVWREMFRRSVSALPGVQNRWVLLGICMTRPSVLDNFKLSESAKALLGNSKSTSPVEVIEALANLDEKQIGPLVSNIAAHVSAGPAGLELKHVTDILRFFEVPVEKFWKLSQKFCELLTKNELDAVCEELGLKAAMGADYAKAKNGSKEDFIKAVLSVEGFAYQGAVPKLMKY